MKTINSVRSVFGSIIGAINTIKYGKISTFAKYY